MLELIWNSQDGRTEIYRHGRSRYSLVHNSYEALAWTSYNRCCWYAAEEFVNMKQELAFPELEHESGFD